MQQRTTMRRRSVTPPGLRNDSNSEGTRSAKDILLQLDPNFSRAVGILNKYMPNEDSTTYNPDDLNQNKAVGTESELNSLSHVNTRTNSPAGQNRIESEQRGGSTMSDLHNTEYMDESKDMKSKTSPYLKSASSRLSDEPGSPRSPAVQRDAPRKPKSPISVSASDAAATAKTISHSELPKPAKQSAPVKKPGQRAAAYSHSPPPPTITRPNRRVESEEAQRRLIRELTREESRESEESDFESNFSDALLEPDPTALRDLDNASPKTIAMCKKHQCHYCFFVYFSSATVDEDLMPFRRKAFTDKVARLSNPEHIREVKDTKCARDAFADRRIKSIELQSGTQIRLSEMNPNAAFIKGLPRRRLTIAGPSFSNIGCALNLFEALLPKVIKTAIFPYRLPHGASTRFSAGNRISSVHQWNYGRCDGAVTLRQQLDDKGGWRSFLVTNK
ncbi:hypothetical protein CRM22_004131 [Opisthorchis felineus]|uniref:Uncharacterized protein n=1 Tax=Opisthorchis felineus TaxID=147828 RepID=A0A4S2M2Y3_OPIFE|nr:hypothetical protein CRM22_004131 [Opisthorchis felineus]TGZ68690.1 hypothetical protein CRM22_004131 [Opisthorchis felineus]TGZ68691.1 hypothetical protein CRM22_004131 [Opisthorchis felineus]